MNSFFFKLLLFSRIRVSARSSIAPERPQLVNKPSKARRKSYPATADLQKFLAYTSQLDI